MSTKHTPGPWEAIQKGGINAPWNVNVPHLSDTDSMKYVAGAFGRTGKEQEANARLIAAAPELLAFAQMVAGGGYDMADIMTEARALIAKATGETI